MFEVCVEETFAAGHALRDYHGKCENVHGHNYRLQVTLRGPELDATGLLVDFVDLKKVIRTAVERLDHQFLNEVAPFDVLNPSAENIARYFFERVKEGLTAQTSAEVAEIRVWETDTASAAYRP
jgi:6-pyruvoyltetrahydropterin/6-carboxytetrahydropterin synthase